MPDNKASAPQKKIYRKIKKLQAGITKTIDVVEHAKIVRTELKRAFPLIRFRVRSSRFAFGTSIDVYHLGDITPEQQGKITDFVREFDGFESDLMDGRYNIGFIYRGERIAGALFCTYRHRWYG